MLGAAWTRQSGGASLKAYLKQMYQHFVNQSQAVGQERSNLENRFA